MRKTVKVEISEPLVLLASEIIYGQRKGWCNGSSVPMALSLIRPRLYSENDKENILPVIVWLCGGAFTSVDRNVWMAELAWFAKRGYAIASIDYSVNYRSHYPELVEDVKLAIRYLKAHHAEYSLDTSRIALMGESAGGYLSAFCALTGENREFDTGGYEDQSSSVQLAIPWYPVIRPSKGESGGGNIILPHDWLKFANLVDFVKPGAPPFLILHGSADTVVPCSHGEELYESLTKCGCDAELIIVEGAGHADAAFVQESIKKEILSFINSRLGR